MSEFQPQPTQPIAPNGVAFEQAPRKTATGVKAGVAAAAALALAAGGVLAVDPFDWRHESSAGPAEVLPADVVAYSAVDSDPKLSQQVEMVRFAMKFPGLKSKLDLDENGDLKKQLWTEAVKDSECARQVDYDAEIKPWIGDRAAIALRKDAKDPVGVIEAKDEKSARAVFDKLAACDSSGEKPSLAWADGYLVVADSQADADAVVADGKANPLSKKAEFSEDLEKVGTTGVMTFWFSKDGLVQLAKSSEVQDANTTSLDTQSIDQAKVRSGAGTLRFSGGNPELHYVVKSSEPLTTDVQPTKVGSLPAETTVAVGIANGAAGLDKAWPELEKAIEEQGGTLAEIEQQTKLKLPDDLKTILGSDLRVAVGEVSTNMQEPTDLPIAVTSATDKAKLTEVVQRTGLDKQGVMVTGTDTQPVVALNEGWAYNVENPTGTLGDSELFKDAVVDADSSEGTVFVNLESLLAVAKSSMTEQQRANVEPLRAVGLSAHTESGDYQAGTLHVTAR